MSHYAFVVDTKQYSGNFTQELGVYVTGFSGDYLHLSDMADSVSESIVNSEWIHDHIIEKIDKEKAVGNSNPPEAAYMIWSGSGWSSVAIFFDKKPSHIVIDELKSRANYFAENKDTLNNEYDLYYNGLIEISGFRLLKMPTKKKIDPADSDSITEISI